MRWPFYSMITLTLLFAVSGVARGALVMNEDLGNQTILTDVLTTETSLDYTLDLGPDPSSGQPMIVRVISNVIYDSGNVRNIFDYQVINASGDDIISIAFFGEEWIGGYSFDSNPWSTSVTSRFIEFYDGDILSGSDDLLRTGTNLLTSWAVGSADFYLSDRIESVHVGVLKPTTVPEPATLGLLMLGAAGLLKGRRR